MSVRLGKASNPAMFVPSAEAIAVKAASSGANTVKVPAGFCKATFNHC